MKRDPLYDLWGPWQKKPTTIVGFDGMAMFLGYMFGYLLDPKWGVIGCFFAAISTSTQHSGHLALRINDVEDRLAQIESSRTTSD